MGRARQGKAGKARGRGSQSMVCPGPRRSAQKFGIIILAKFCLVPERRSDLFFKFSVVRGY